MRPSRLIMEVHEAPFQEESRLATGVRALPCCSVPCVFDPVGSGGAAEDSER